MIDHGLTVLRFSSVLLVILFRMDIPSMDSLFSC